MALAPPSFQPIPARAPATAAATTALALLVQVAAWRAAGCPVPPALFGAHLSVLAILHGGAALLFGARWGRRPWALILLLAPALLAALPAIDRCGGLAAVVAVGATGAVALGLVARVGLVSRRLGFPLPAALLGAALGVAVAAANAPWRFEGEPVFSLSLGLVLAVAALGALGARALQPPGTRTAMGITAAALASAAVLARGGALPAIPSPPGAVTAGPALPSIALIVLDTVRADHLRAYGSRRDPMPRLERFARQNGVRVERSLANAASSLESHGSMFTGLSATHHGAHKPAASDPRPPRYAWPLPADVPTLAGRLSRAGYWTVGISANYGPLAPAFGLGHGFSFYEAVPGSRRRAALLDPFRFALDRRWPLATLDRFPPFRGSEFFELGVPTRRAAEIVDRGVEALDRAGSRPLFLFLNFIDTHYPYRPPRSFTGVYPGVHRPGLAPLPDEQAAAWQAMAGRHALAAEERAAWEAEYDSAMAYLDRELGRLLDRLRRDPRFPGMLVLITSDHGEGFGEHGIFRHSTGLYDELLHVPLFIKPGERRPADFVSGATVTGPFQSVDVFPTVLAHAGLPVPRSLDGLAWGTGRTVSYSESYVHPPAAVAFGGRFRAEVRTVETNGWKLLAWSTGERELYELRADPGERRDLAPAHPGEVARLESLLRSGPAPLGGARRPGRRAPWNERIERDLRSLGYLR